MASYIQFGLRRIGANAYIPGGDQGNMVLSIIVHPNFQGRIFTSPGVIPDPGGIEPSSARIQGKQDAIIVRIAGGRPDQTGESSCFSRTVHLQFGGRVAGLYPYFPGRL